MLDNVSVYHSSIRIEENSIVYFDPYKVEKEYNDADVIFITHSHYDHFSIEDILKVIKENTIIVMPGDMENNHDLDIISKKLNGEVKFLFKKPFEKDNCVLSSGIRIEFETIPSYNTNKKFHPKENGWLGYIVNIDGKNYYIAGDTDITEEAKEVKCDVAFLPCGGTYTMTATEAANLANIIKPEVAVPTHYGAIVGDKDDGKMFISLLNNVKGVEIIK